MDVSEKMKYKLANAMKDLLVHTPARITKAIPKKRTLQK